MEMVYEYRQSIDSGETSCRDAQENYAAYYAGRYQSNPLPWVAWRNQSTGPQATGRYIRIVSCILAIVKARVKLWHILICTLFVTTNLCSQTIDMSEVSAREEFRWGVTSFHAGLFNKAILSFEKSLSARPTDPVIQDWLARSYIRSGLEQTALKIYENLIHQGKSTALIQNRVDLLRYKQGVDAEIGIADKWVISEEIPAKRNDMQIFSRPASLTPASDGGFFLASYASNEIVQFDANGSIVRTIRGGLEGIDHPFDALNVGDRYLFITEFRGDRILRYELEGRNTVKFGQKGLKEGQLLGPQFLASDGSDYVYVTEQGNRRVSKFDIDGKFVLSFGKQTGSFPGFREPTGIVVHHGMVFVADAGRRSIDVFDGSGNFVRSYGGSGELTRPEGLSVYQDNVLLVADGREVRFFDIENELFMSYAKLPGDSRRVVKAERDANGNIIVSDFDADRVSILSELSGMYAGLSVQIDRIISEQFPEVYVEVSVKDKSGFPLTGLTLSNFVVRERVPRDESISIVYGSHKTKSEPVAVPAPGTVIQPQNVSLFYDGNAAQYANIALLYERSGASALRKTEFRDATDQILKSIKGRGSLIAVSASEHPSLDTEKDAAANSIAKAAIGGGPYTEGWRFDMGLRLAASELVNGRGKRAVVFFSTGSLGTKAFDTYGLVECASFLTNNNISFFCIYTDREFERAPKELEYLCRATGGKSYFLYRPEGVGGVVDDVLSVRVGTYILKYTSGSYADFGNSFIPVEVEAFLFKRSGRDELGYYAPLEF